MERKLCIPLDQYRARDLMKPLPKCIDEHTLVRDATIFLIRERLTAAPVANSAGRVVGVLSMTHILTAQRQSATVAGLPFSWEKYSASRMEFFERADLSLPEVESSELETRVGERQVRDVMSFELYTVHEQAPTTEVIHAMLNHKVHRIFVVDASDNALGVISAFDILAVMCGLDT